MTIRVHGSPRRGERGHDGAPDWRLVLYVAGMGATARRTLANLDRICKAYLADRYTLDIVDLLDQPDRAEGDEIIAVPTLVRERPRPRRKIIGDLSSTGRVLESLEVDFAILTDGKGPTR